MSSESKKHKAKGKIHRWFRSGKELKNTNKCKGLHFYNSANRQRNKKMLDEEIEETLDLRPDPSVTT